MSEASAAAALRELMRSAPQLVTVVTATGSDGPRGITVSSFIPVSLAPPLVLVSIANAARAHGAIAAGRFRVHLLAADQAAVASHFARPGLGSTEQFDGEFERGVGEAGTGSPPRIGGVIGWAECRTAAAHGEGDHTLFVGRVLAAAVERAEAMPLLYHQRGYRQVGGAADDPDA